jgi:hypothetical protein
VKQHKPRTLPGSNLGGAEVAVAVVSASSPRRRVAAPRPPRRRRGDRGDEGWEAHRANPKSARFFAPSPIVHLSESGLSAYAFRARESTEERR